MGSRPFRSLIVATTTSFTGYVLLLPLVPLWAIRGGAGEVGAGATTAVYMLATVLTQLLMPWLLRRGGYHWTMPVGALLLGLPALLFLLTTDITALLAISAVRGVGFGMVSVAGSALAARLVPDRQIGRAAGYYGIAVGIPIILLLWAGVWIALTLGFAVVFWIATAGPILGAVAALGARPGRGDVPADGPTDPDAAWPTGRRLRAALAVPFVVMLASAIASSAIVTFLAIPLSGSPLVVSAALLGFGVASVGTRWLAGTLSDRYGRVVTLLPGTLAAAAGMALLAYPLMGAGQGAASLGGVGATVAVLGATLFGAGFGGIQNDTIVVMFHRGGPPGYGAASAAWNIGFDGGTGIGAIVLGAAVHLLGYGPAFLGAGIAVLACLPLVVPRRGR